MLCIMSMSILTKIEVQTCVCVCWGRRGVEGIRGKEGLACQPAGPLNPTALGKGPVCVCVCVCVCICVCVCVCVYMCVCVCVCVCVLVLFSEICQF